MDEPPRIDPDKISFDIFHDLMHRPFTAYCRSMHGGSRHHLSLWWDYIGRPRLGRALRCRFGRHRWCDGWSQALGDSWICGDCHEQREK